MLRRTLLQSLVVAPFATLGGKKDSVKNKPKYNILDTVLVRSTVTDTIHKGFITGVFQRIPCEAERKDKQTQEQSIKVGYTIRVIKSNTDTLIRLGISEDSIIRVLETENA